MLMNNYCKHGLTYMFIASHIQEYIPLQGLPWPMLSPYHIQKRLLSVLIGLISILSQLDLELLPQDADILPFPTVKCGQFGWGCQNSQKSMQNASKLSLNLQIIPQLLIFTGPTLKPPYLNEPEWMAILLYLLIHLNKFKDFAIDISWRWPWNDNVHK